MLFNLSTLLTFSLISLSLAASSPSKRASNLRAPHRFDRIAKRQDNGISAKVVGFTSVPVVGAIQTVSVVDVANAALATAPPRDVGIGAKVLGFSSLVAGQTGGVAVAVAVAAATPAAVGGVGAKFVTSSVVKADQVPEATATAEATAKASTATNAKTGVKTVFRTKTVTVTATASPTA